MRKSSSKRTPVIILSTILMTVGCSGLAFGQFQSTANMLNTTIMSSNNSLFTAQTAVIQQRKSMAIAAGVWPGGTSPSAAGTKPAPQQPLASRYDISATDFLPVSGPIIPDQLANSATGVDPQTRETMRNLFKQALTSFEAEARKNNMANAFAFVTAIALQTRFGKELNETQADQLIVYFNNVLGSTPAFYTTNPRQQQVLYESLIITGNLIALLDSQGKQANNQQMRTQAMNMSQAVIKQFLGFDAK
jgi:hypothetical protein